MKKLTIYLIRFLFIISITQLAGCRKLIDIIFHEHGNNREDCQIKRVGQKSGYGDLLIFGNVTYNNNEQPVSVIYDSLNNITPWRFFEYDNSDRLIEYRAEWGPGREFYTEIHRYGYSPSGLIVIDTAYLQVEGTFNLIYYLEYDNQKRVIKQDEYILHDDGTTSYFRTEAYNYGSDGNLILENQTYDNKPSYIGTNKIWKFVNRNYSKNNVAGALTYNEQGLPLSFGESNGAFLGNSTPDVIEYDCE
jgi:hypothetical protein